MGSVVSGLIEELEKDVEARRRLAMRWIQS